MYVSKVTLKDIRGFADLDFDLAREDGSFAGWTVFTGDNGSGKSTLLKAISIGLVGKDTARALQPSFNRWVNESSADNTASVQLEIVRVQGDDALALSGKAPGDRFPARIELANGGKETTLRAGLTKKSRKYSTPERTLWSTDATGWFSCGYGPFRRVFGASSEAMQQMLAPSTARFATMFQEAASLAEADRWLRDLKYKELEDQQKDQNAESEPLKILLQLLKDDLIPKGLSVDRVDSDGLWLVDKNGVQLAWAEMSDGYRAALALLTDIVRHLVIAYGTHDLTEKDKDGLLVIKRSGVVLIDEIDAHLHPAWQREIGFWLKRHFPHIQFLVTTHSPLICQAADSNGLFVLPEPTSGADPRALSKEEYSVVIASRPDTILLTAAFGLQNTRSPRAVSGRAELAKLSAKKRSGAKLSKDEVQMEMELKVFAPENEEV